MIPFSYHFEEMLDYYDFNYNSIENNRKITWDTKNLRREWMPHVYTIKGYYESDEDFNKQYEISQRKLNEYFDNLHSGRYIEVDEVIWKPNYEFEDTLKYSHCSRGRSSWKLHFVSTISNHKYEMFSTDFDDLMKAKGFDKDIVSGRFTFVKRGSNYGIKIVI